MTTTELTLFPVSPPPRRTIGDGPAPTPDVLARLALALYDRRPLDDDLDEALSWLIVRRGQPVPLDGPGKVGRDHPATSRRAASIPKFGSQRFRVLSVLVAAGVTGATAAEIADRVRLSRNQAAARLMELREANLASRLAAERKTGPSTTGRVHVASSLGRTVVREGGRR